MLTSATLVLPLLLPSSAPQRGTPTVGNLQGPEPIRTLFYRCRNPGHVKIRLAPHTEDDPLDVNMELWQGACSTPVKMRVHSDKGCTTPFETIIPTFEDTDILAIRPSKANVMSSVFPAAYPKKGLSTLIGYSDRDVMYAGGERTYSLPPDAVRAHVLLTTDGEPLNARIELLRVSEGDAHMVVELSSEDAGTRPFFCSFAPQTASRMRIVNTALRHEMTATLSTTSITPTAERGVE